MKKVLASVLAAAMVFALAACGGSSSSAPASSSAPRGRAFVGKRDAPLPVHTLTYGIPGFGATLSPATLSARGCSTSELLRTLSRNGCF